MSTSLRYTLAALLAVSLLALSLPAAASTGLQDHTAAAVAAAEAMLRSPTALVRTRRHNLHHHRHWLGARRHRDVNPAIWFAGVVYRLSDAYRRRQRGLFVSRDGGHRTEWPHTGGRLHITYVENYDGSSLSATQTFTVTPTSTLPDLLTDETYLPACFLSMGALAVALVAATEETGAILAWEGALALLDATGKLGDFLNQLQTNQYWAAALINAGIIDPLNECLTSVQVLLNDTSGQAGVAVAQWMEKDLCTRREDAFLYRQNVVADGARLARRNDDQPGASTPRSRAGIQRRQPISAAADSPDA